MKLVAYFSATDKTKELATTLANYLKADLFEIEPEVKYTKADLSWINLRSRSSIEMHNKASRPKIVVKPLDVNKYDEIYLGFPIWWYVAPTIINTFLETYDFTNKKIILFATSGGSGFGKTVMHLAKSTKAQLIEGKVNPRDFSSWIK